MREEKARPSTVRKQTYSARVRELRNRIEQVEMDLDAMISLPKFIDFAIPPKSVLETGSCNGPIDIRRIPCGPCLILTS